MSVVQDVANLKVSNAALDRLREAEDKLKNGQDAYHDKLSALIQLDRFAAAGNALRTTPALLERFPAEAAYIFYQLSDLSALRDLSAAHPQNTPVSLALSQAEYRAGHYDAAAAALQNISVHDDEIIDLRVNQNAIAAQRGIFDSNAEDIPAFERHFNAAYALLARGEPTQALKELRTAKTEAGDDEQASIALQAAYAHIIMGDLVKARELLAALDDPLADVNKLVCNPPGDIESELKALRLFDSIPSNLVASQLKVILGNKLRLQARVGLPVAGKAAKHLNRFATDLTPSVLAAHALTAHELRQEVARNPTNAAAVFALAQTLVNENRLEEACHLLLGLGRASIVANADISPGVLGAIAAAHKHLRLDPTELVKKVFATSNLSGDFAGAAAILAESGDADAIELADVYFASCHESSLEARAGKCAVRPTEASVAGLPSVEALTQGVDAEELESKGLFALASHTKVSLRTDLPRRRRSGKRKLPANYDEAKQPDPERWLAKQDRSSYKPKKKRNAAQGATQGATQGSTTSSPAPGQVASTPSSSTASKKKKNKKKK